MSPRPTGPSADNADFDVFACPLDGTRLIEASAGTGKTWSLAGLYLRLLLERGLPVAQILVVTFTKAAVAELRDRIRSRIAETLQHLRGPAAAPDAFIDALLQQLRAAGLADELLRQRLELALQQFDEAAILTIHGFCQRALAEAPFSSGMPLHVLLTKADKLAFGAAKNALLKVQRDIRQSWGDDVSVQLFSAPKRLGIDEALSVLARWMELGEEEAEA